MGGRSESFLQEEVPTLAWTKAGNVSLVNPRHIEGCESLLETYFMQVSLPVHLAANILFKQSIRPYEEQCQQKNAFASRAGLQYRRELLCAG